VIVTFINNMRQLLIFTHASKLRRHSHQYITTVKDGGFLSSTKYINLGALKSTTGKQSYDVTGMPDLAEYKFVLVWCQQFSVLFGKAELQ
jgi:hypothetical protein